MEATRRYRLANLVIAALAIGHAVDTWPARAAVALFTGGAVLAFVAEAVVVALGLLDHTVEPQVLGVPVSVILVWPAIVYVCLRLSLLVVPPGPIALLLAGAIGSILDLATEPFALADGVWTYPEHPLSEPRIVGVPWWNVIGWVALVGGAGALPLVVGL